MNDLVVAEVFHEAGEVIPLRPAPVEAVAERVRARQRRRVRWVAGVALAVLVVVGVGTWWGTRSEEPALPETEVTERANPAGIAWYANGVLHLPDVAVTVPQVRELVEIPDGAVYVDRSGRVVLVDQEGELTLLGRTGEDSRLVGSAERAWVAWLETGGDEPELVVHDTLARTEVDRRVVADDVRPLALDQDRVYYVDDDGSWAWPVPDGEPSQVSDEELLDVASAVRVLLFSDANVLVAQPLFDIDVTVPGRTALLSPGGDYVLTRVDMTQPNEVRIYEAATGDDVYTGIRPTEVALDAAFGPDDTVTYVVAVRDHAPEEGDYLRLSATGPHLLRTCELEAGRCRTISQFDNATGETVLAH